MRENGLITVAGYDCICNCAATPRRLSERHEVMRENKYSVKTRKQLDRLARFLSDILEAPARLEDDGGYVIDQTRLNPDGYVTWGDNVTDGLLELVLWESNSEGLKPEPTPEPDPDPEPEPTQKPAQEVELVMSAETTGLVIQIYAGDNPEETFKKLKTLVYAKADLIRKACRADRVTVELKDGVLHFPWWDQLPDFDLMPVFNEFLAAMIRYVQNVTRVVDRDTEVTNEKYSMRTFLLRLGYVGKETAPARKILLKPLEGSAAWKTPPENK